LKKALGFSFKFFGICEEQGVEAFRQMSTNLGGSVVSQVTPEMLDTELVTVLNSFNKS